MNEERPSPIGYRNLSLHYLDNAFDALQAGDSEKGSEFLWGSMAAALKAVAATRGTHLPSHRDLWDYARGLARELGEENLFVAFRDANSLHSNFYESRLQVEDVRLIAEGIRAAVGRLLSLSEQLELPETER